MSARARHVLALIDEAERIRERHPSLFAAQAYHDRDVRQLAAALSRYKREKPTAHARPFRDDVEPVDEATVERMAREREDYDRGRRIRFNAHERERRMRLAGLELAVEVRDEARTISTVAAGNIEPSRGGGKSGGLPHQQRLDDDPRWQLAERLIHRHALILRELVDEARGLSRSVAASLLSAEEKDRTIDQEGVGLTADELFHRLGPEYGSISYIRRHRRERELDTRGRSKPSKEQA